jgi:hypothetical protein
MAQRNRILLAIAALALAAFAILRRKGDESPPEQGTWEPV